ncbi:MAG: EF-hand domain-containing protein [Bryobacteraceae bacterium]
MMGRWLYIALLRLHPRAFRERFGDEMIHIFDEEGRGPSSTALLLDGVNSLFRQWVRRPARQQPSLSMASPVTPPGVPVFQTFESYSIRRGALVNGVVLSIVLFGVVNFSISKAGVRFPQPLIGAKYPRPTVLPMERSSIAEREATTDIKVASPPVDPLYELAGVYFKIIRVLYVLDANQDRDISEWEIVTAASPLKRLDLDRDGKLSAEECGFSMEPDPTLVIDPAFVRRARLEFMRGNPVLAALDADHSGEISADEIENSSLALRGLDRNHDGALTPVELLPVAIDNRVTLIMSRIDTDRDRSISPRERASEFAQPLRELLERADRNGDGVVTSRELSQEVQLRDEMKRQREKALGSAGFTKIRRDGSRQGGNR